MTNTVGSQEQLMTRDELLATLPEMGMTQELDLVAVRPDGSENPARIGYSSDLAAFALMTYGPYGEDGELGITSWYPLPTRTTSYFKGQGAVTHIKHADQAERVDNRPRTEQTLFRIATSADETY